MPCGPCQARASAPSCAWRSEPDPVAALGALSRLGLLAALDPRLEFEEPLARRALAMLPEDGAPHLLLLACLLLPAATAAGGEDPAQAMLGLLDELEFTAGDRDRAIRAARLAPGLLAPMAGRVTVAAARGGGHGATLEAVALAGALGGAQAPRGGGRRAPLALRAAPRAPGDHRR